MGQETAAWSLWVWDTGRGGRAKRGMEIWGRGLSDSASVPADMAKMIDLPTTMAMLVITAANAGRVLTCAFPHTASFRPPPKSKEVTT